MIGTTVTKLEPGWGGRPKATAHELSTAKTQKTFGESKTFA